MSEEFEASDPSGTRTVSSHSTVSSNSTTPLSPDHILTHVSTTPTPTRVSFHRRTARMAMRTQLTLSRGMLARIAEATALSLSVFYKSEGDELGEVDTKEDEEDESSDADEERENQGLDDKGQGLEDEGPGMEEEEATPKGQQQAVLVFDTAASEPLGLGYGAARSRTLESIEEITPSTYETPSSLEWSLGSLPVSPSSPVVPSPIASLVATPTATISIDEDQFLEVGAQLELHGSQERLETRSSHKGQTDAQRADLWHSIYDIQMENHDLRMQLSEKRRERLELADHVARIERRQESREE
ncbi:hypothetical protein Tco_1424231 [Tanacetum coccineum]